MSHHEAESETADEVTASLDRVVAELRTPVPVRMEWRAGVLRGVAMLPSPGEAAEAPRAVKQWRLRPLTAIAAGLVCALAGAAATALLLGGRVRRDVSDQLVNLPATMPVPAERAGVAGAYSTVRFFFVAPYATRVSLVGDFNGWNPSAMPMHRSGDGRSWMLDVPLAPGRHVYSFIVDGDLAPDPGAPRAGDDDFGVPSSVVLVAAGGAKT
ncbi:MAG TPA: hypothetical protein VGH98_12410 [Gemmatimonadaceae bacterium]|jgi:hypothetical protein